MEGGHYDQRGVVIEELEGILILTRKTAHL